MDDTKKLEIDHLQELEESKNESSIPIAAEVRDTPPLSPSYMIAQNISSEKEMHMKGPTKSKKRTSTKAARRATGTKGVRKGRRSDSGFDSGSRGESEEIGFLFNEDDDERRKTRTSFQPMELPSEYCETHYYSCISINNHSLVLDNKFWLDLAKHLLEKKSFEGFLSGNFILVTSNISEIIFSNAFLDIPFAAGNHETKKLEDKGIKIKID